MRKLRKTMKNELNNEIISVCLKSKTISSSNCSLFTSSVNCSCNGVSCFHEVIVEREGIPS